MMPGPAYGKSESQIKSLRRSKPRGSFRPSSRVSRAKRSRLHPVLQAKLSTNPITRRTDALDTALYNFGSKPIADKRYKDILERLSKTSPNFAKKIAKANPSIDWNVDLSEYDAAGMYGGPGRKKRVSISPEITLPLLDLFPRPDASSKETRQLLKKIRRDQTRGARKVVIHELAHATQDNAQGRKFYDRARKKILRGKMLRGKQLRRAMRLGYEGITPFDYRTIVEGQAELKARKATRRAYGKVTRPTYPKEVARFKRLRLGR